MGNNYAEYALLKDDDSLEQCILYFWDSLEDDVYPKKFLESLMQMVDDVNTGKVKTYPMEDVIMDGDFIEMLKDITKDAELNEE